MKSILSILLCLFVFGLSANSKTSSELVGTVGIEPGVYYNNTLGCFEFTNKKYFNKYLVKIENNFDAIETDEELLLAYVAFEKKYKHQSLRKVIDDLEFEYFETNIWTEENDPDRHFVQDETLRLLLNKFNEIIVAGKLITLLDLCELLKVDARLTDVIKRKRSLVLANKLNELPEEVEMDIYCKTGHSASEGGDCCDKNDRNKEKFHEYSGNRKMKAVFWQKNIWSLGYHKIGARTKNYRKKSNGNWTSEKANLINVYYGGLIYGFDANNNPCSQEAAFGTFGKERYNRRKARDYHGVGYTFWSKNGSLISLHRAEDAGSIGTVQLCLNDTYCDGCPTIVGDGNTDPLNPMLVGPGIICTGEASYVIHDFFSSGGVTTQWTVTSNLQIISSTNTGITVAPIAGTAGGFETITATYGFTTVTLDIWVGDPDFSVAVNYDAGGDFATIGLNMFSYQGDIATQDFTSITWQKLSGQGWMGNAANSTNNTAIVPFGQLNGKATGTNACGTDEAYFTIVAQGPESPQVNVDKGMLKVTSPANNVPGQSRLQEASNYTIKDIKLFDMAGKLVARSTSSEIDISTLPQGIYLVSLEMKNGEILTEKIFNTNNQ